MCCGGSQTNTIFSVWRMLNRRHDTRPERSQTAVKAPGKQVVVEDAA